MRWLSAALCVVALLVAAPSSYGSARPPSIQDLEESLTCQCGCGLTVHSCNHVDCSSAIPLRKEIREQLEAGKSREQILRHFVEKYGEKILSAPTFQGFNVLAWTTPFLMLALGGLGLVVILRHWGRQEGKSSSAGPLESTPSTLVERYQRKLEDELKRFEEV